ncbi:MAG: hypothetical protein AAF215_32645 [Cyanobacteria bacterium P01_A01_bin.123]
MQKSPNLPLADAIAQIDVVPFAESVRGYLSDTLGAAIAPTDQTLINIDQVKSEIQRRLRTYLIYKRDALQESILNISYRKTLRPTLMQQAAEHFLTYLLREGNLVG